MSFCGYSGNIFYINIIMATELDTWLCQEICTSGTLRQQESSFRLQIQTPTIQTHRTEEAAACTKVL